MSRLNAAQTSECFSDIARTIATLQGAHRDLRHRDRDDPGPGYPPSSLGGGSRGAGDPVGELVANLDEAGTRVADDSHDNVRRAIREIEQAIVSVRRTLDAAMSHVGKTRAAAPASRTEDVWCTSCLRSNVFTPRSRDSHNGQASTLCRWCHDWNARQGDLPPAELIDRRSRGERITSRVIDEVCGKRRHDRGARKRRHRQGNA